MKGEIVAVGTELLLGQIVNTNARYLAGSLARLGIDIYYQTVVGDNRERLVDTLRQALRRSGLVVTCGGLGPTEDDLTRQAVADSLGVGLKADEDVRKMVEDYCGRRHPAGVCNHSQWFLPEGARPLRNDNGSAPGFILEARGKFIVCLPGPPRELEPMFERHVVPFLADLPGRTPMIIHSRVIHLCGIGEAAAEERIRDLLSSTNPSIAPYARPGQVDLRITVKASSAEEARRLIAPLEEEVRTRFDLHAFGADGETLPSVIGEALRLKGLTLSLAESCTGGSIGWAITDVEGSSDYFLFDAVVYANETKERVLGVPAELLGRWGAVSRQTAVAMAEGVRRVAGSDLAVSVTGIAGPAGGTPDKPVGTVFFGLAVPEGTWWRVSTFFGDRDTVRQWAVQEALTFLYFYLKQPADPGGKRVSRP